MIFEVTPEHIEALSDTELRTLIGYLAEQEAVRAGHSASSVTYGGHQNAKDGGIDVRVDLGAAAIKGYIPRGQTGFQVKAEDMPNGDIISEMRPKGKLRPSIIKLGEAGGAYVIVSSKGSVSDTSLSNRRNSMSGAITDQPTASGLHVDFYDRRKLASWVNQHPGLIPWVRSKVGLPLSGWRPFEDWSSSPGAANEKYLTDDHVRLVGVRLKDTDGLGAVAGIEKLRELLSKPKGTVRLVGLSGVGKTRLIQALFDNTIGSYALSPHLAVYTDLADSPDPIPLELLGRLINLGQQCILIVDNCGADLHRKLSARMKNAPGAVSLVTIEYDVSDDEPENTDTFKLEPASSEIIEKIVERRYPNLTAPEIRTIASFSEGNSRIALALAETAKHGESLANLQDSGLIKRLFHQNHQEDPALLRAAKACALVYSFDGETLEGDESELPRLAALAGQTVAELHGHIAELYRRQLVQKRSNWRALLPHALAHKLAKQALQDFPAELVKKQLAEGAPPRFLKSFSRRLGCLHDSPEAQAIVADWLGQNGWIAKIEKLDDIGIVVLDNIAPVNPDAVMTAIEEAIQRNGTALGSHSHRVTSLLRSLAYNPSSFDKATMLIAVLAQDETSSNNTGAAINVFKSMFFLHLSGTHALAPQRANLLRAIAASTQPQREALVMAGLDAMLECSHFSSSYGFEFGTRKRDYGYHPKTYGEVWEWYREALKLAGDLVSQNGFRDAVRKMIGSQFRFLASRTNSTDALIALADHISSDGGWPEGWAGASAAARALKKANRKEDADKLRTLADRLKPDTLQERIASYVLPEQWGALDIAEIDFDDEKRYEKAQKKIEAICEGIGKEIAGDFTTLTQHLPAMLQSSSMRVSVVARTIGRETKQPRAAWEAIVTAVTSPVHSGKIFGFPSSFLLGLSEADKPLSETLLDEALATSALHPFFVHMQAVVGVDKAASARIIKAALLETIPVHMFRMLGHGRACDDLPSPQFKDMLLAIAAREGGLELSLDILHMRMFSKSSDKKPLEKEEKDAGRALLEMVVFEERNQSEARILAEVVRKCLASPADDGVAEQLCERLAQGIAQYKIYESDYRELIADLSAAFPRIVLDVLVERGAGAFEGRRGIFRSSRANSACPLRKISDDDLLEWAHEQPETRFLQIAEVISPGRPTAKNISNDNDPDEDAGPIEWSPAALRILREAPEPLAILRQYLDNFRPSSWSGSLADILETRLPLLELIAQDSNAQVTEAAQAAITSFKKEIEQTREWEAKRSRDRDERFEW